MSTAERRVQNEEVEIRRTYDSRITTNKVLILATSDLILFPMPNEEVGDLVLLSLLIYLSLFFSKYSEGVRPVTLLKEE